MNPSNPNPTGHGERRKRNSSKVNLVFSFIFHALVLLGAFYFAAREGIMGDKMKTLVATLEQKPKVETPKPKEEPKVEQAKPAETPKTVAAAPAPRVETPNAPPPVEAPPSAAPPTLDATFFSEGAKAVAEVTDPKLIYKGAIERALLARWTRPEDLKDDDFVAEVELSIGPDGKVTGHRMVKGSGNAQWDKSVETAVAATKNVGTPPPVGFPATFKTRFDVEMTRSEEVFHVSSR
jgi:TonB family protein